MKTLFLVNPRAGRGAALKTWHHIEAEIAGRPGIDAVIPDSAEGTRKAATDAVKAGYDRVVVVGGDGTLLSVVDELAHTDTQLGVIPAGTGNDFCRTSDIPRRWEAALTIALGAHARPIDLGKIVGGRHFINAASAGLDAQVAISAAHYPQGLGGSLPYLLAALGALRSYRPAPVEIQVDDQVFDGPITLAVVANGRYYGGGMKIAPTARRDDGMFDVYIADALSRPQILKLLPTVYSGSHVKSPAVHMLRGRQVRIRLKEPVALQVDGDGVQLDTLAFEVQPQALQVALPPDGAR